MDYFYYNSLNLIVGRDSNVVYTRRGHVDTNNGLEIVTIRVVAEYCKVSID